MDTKILKQFCKNNKTVGEKMGTLFEKFNQIQYVRGKEAPIQREDFEMGLLFMGSKVAKKLKENCLTYPKDQHEKFIREQEFASQKFWNHVHSITEPQPAVTEPQPSLEPSKNVTELVKIEEEKHPESIPELSINDMELKCYEGLLPSNWIRMTLPERIDFTKKVHHKGFRSYIFDLDKKIDAYFKKVKDKPTTADMAIYVTLFSFPADNYSTEAKSLLKCFIDVLNDLGRARLQYIECNEPKTVEVREVRL